MLHASGDIQNFTADTITTDGLSLISDNGVIGNGEAPIRIAGAGGGAVTLKEVTTNGEDVRLYSFLSVSVAGLGEGNDAVSLNGGQFDLSALGDITVTAGIATYNNRIRLDATGTITVNANITADDQNLGIGEILLEANDFNLSDGAGTSDTNGIFGSGTLTASAIFLDVNGSRHGLSGGVGTQAAPLHLDTHNADGDLISLSVSTFGGNVFLNSAKSVSLDVPYDESADLVAVNLLPDLSQSPGATTGSFSLTAAACGEPTAVSPYAELILNTTGSDGFITLNAAPSVRRSGNQSKACCASPPSKPMPASSTAVP